MAGRPKLTDHPVVKGVANKLGATTAQVLIAWGVRRGYSVIPKSVHEDRIISNFKQINLSQEDYKKVSSIGHNNHTRWARKNTYLWLLYCISAANFWLVTKGSIFRIRFIQLCLCGISTYLMSQRRRWQPSKSMSNERNGTNLQGPGPT